MFMRIVCCALGAALLVAPGQAQPQKKEDPNKAELEKLRAQVQALQLQVQALHAQVQALQEKLKDQMPQFPQPLTPSSAPRYGGDPKITTGVAGVCWLQFIPGVQGAKTPAPTRYEGATVQIFPLKGKKAVAEGKSNDSGGFRIAVKPGKYRVEVVPRDKSVGAASPIEVTVEEGKLREVEITLFQLGV
jgi:hypothetical protein